jgi:hypothetical protein
MVGAVMRNNLNTETGVVVGACISIGGVYTAAKCDGKEREELVYLAK